MGPELQIFIVTVLFLGLLTAGMPVPFAIAVPAVVYLLMQGGFDALNGLGLMSWGSMNSFALTAVPLFMLYIGVHAALVPGVAPKEHGAKNIREVLRALADILPFVVLILGTLGGLYFGVVTTTEAAVIGCFLSLLLGFLFGDLTVTRVVH